MQLRTRRIMQTLLASVLTLSLSAGIQGTTASAVQAATTTQVTRVIVDPGSFNPGDNSNYAFVFQATSALQAGDRIFIHFAPGVMPKPNAIRLGLESVRIRAVHIVDVNTLALELAAPVAAGESVTILFFGVPNPAQPGTAAFAISTTTDPVPVGANVEYRPYTFALDPASVPSDFKGTIAVHTVGTAFTGNDGLVVNVVDSQGKDVAEKLPVTIANQTNGQTVTFAWPGNLQVGSYTVKVAPKGGWSHGIALEVVKSCGTVFTDVNTGDLDCALIEHLAKHKVVNGYPDGTFQPAHPVTRAEFAKLIVTAAGLSPDTAATVGFPDAQGHWAATQGYLQVAVRLGAISGFPDGTFHPDDQVTRSQLIKIAAAAAGLKAGGEAPYSDAKGQWYEGWAAAAAKAGLIGPGTSVWAEFHLDGEQPATRRDVARILGNLLTYLSQQKAAK